MIDLNLIPDAIIIVDQNGRIVEFNQQAEIMFGYTQSELLGRLVEDLIPEEYRGSHMNYRSKYIQEPTMRSMGTTGLDLRGLCKNGRIFPVEIMLSPLGEDTNKFYAVIRDATDRQKTEQGSSLRFQRLIILYATILHLWQGSLLIYSETAGYTTSTNSILRLSGGQNVIAGLLIILAVLCAVRWFQKGGLYWLIPQHSLLILAAFRAIQAIVTSQFADGVVRDWPFIAADQFPIVLLWFTHGLSVLFYEKNSRR